MKKHRIASRLAASAALLVASALSPTVLADGSEALGAPSVTIASGTGIAAAGTGLFSQPGTINLTVPAGATVRQALLYWEGQHVAPNPGDATIVVGGTTVTGALIGGPTFYYTNGGQTILSSSYRADITSLGLVAAGANSLSVSGLDYGFLNNGAGLVVVYDAGGTPAQILVRDGDDLAFTAFAPPLDGTAPVNFGFAAEASPRSASLTLQFAPEAVNRPSSIEVTVAGSTTVFSDLLGDAEGLQWDTIVRTISIPAGASSLTVQAFSRDDLASGRTPASFAWINASLVLAGSVSTPCTGSIGNFVWDDLDRDGVQDGGEPGLSGVRVNLKNTGGSVIATSTTAGGGNYSFTSLCAGAYTVEIDAATLPAAYVPSPCNVGTDSLDNDCSPASVSLATNSSSNTSTDFGFHVSGCSASIGDFVWNDLDRDGAQDSGEAGLAGVRVTLQNTLLATIGSTTTSGAGAYEFSGLCAGGYRVVVDKSTLPSSFVPSPCDAPGVSNALDNDCSPEPVVLTDSLTANRTIDFGFRKLIEGCGQGFWKNKTNAWGPTGYSPTQTIGSVFTSANTAFPSLASQSLRAGLGFSGGSGLNGGAQLVLRSAITALLNASHPNIDSPTDPARLIADVNAALTSGNRQRMVKLHAGLNTFETCPLN